MKNIYIIILSLILGVSSQAQDTFSICAIDTVTGEIGSAGASCVYISGSGVMIISDIHPGVGVIHTQAWWREVNQNYASGLMEMGIAPLQIIDSLVANDEESTPSKRQYGIVDFRDNVVRSAGFTGEDTDDYKNHILGPNYAIQGNILLGPEILDSIEARFLRSEGELACRLMEALQGANVPGADSRCLGNGTSSIGGFLRVAKPDDDPDNLYLQFNVIFASGGTDPIDSLQVLLDQWGGCDPTTINDLNESNVIQVYPNPATNLVNFEFQNDTKSSENEIMIYNSLGAIVLKDKFESQNYFRWGTKNIERGLYFYKIILNGQVSKTGKIIIE